MPLLHCRIAHNLLLCCRNGLTFATQCQASGERVDLVGCLSAEALRDI